MGSKQDDRPNSSKNVPRKAVKRTRFYDSKNNRPKPQKSARSSNKDPFEGITFSGKDLLKELPKGTFSGDSRIFVGNLPREVSKDQVKDLFTPFGQVSEVYVSDKGFSFVKMNNRSNADAAISSLDGNFFEQFNRRLNVKKAASNSIVKLKELPGCVSNEMLYHTFSVFGQVERAIVSVDEKGRPIGEGIVEFESRVVRDKTIDTINNGVFLMSTQTIPIVAEEYRTNDEIGGLPERSVQKSLSLMEQRRQGPRFAARESFEEFCGIKWKEEFEFEREQREKAENIIKQNRVRLVGEMQVAYDEYQAYLLREDLMKKQVELERFEAERKERRVQLSQKAKYGRMTSQGPSYSSNQMPSSTSAYPSPYNKVNIPPPPRPITWEHARNQIDCLLTEATRPANFPSKDQAGVSSEVLEFLKIIDPGTLEHIGERSLIHDGRQLANNYASHEPFCQSSHEFTRSEYCRSDSANRQEYQQRGFVHQPKIIPLEVVRQPDPKLNKSLDHENLIYL